MRKRTTDKVYVRAQWYLERAVTAVYQHGRHIDLRPLTHVVRLAVRAFDVETNPMGMITIQYTTIARNLGVDVRMVKRCLGFFEEVGMLTNVTEGRRHTLILRALSTYEGDKLTSIDIQESKESKERSISPCTPSLSKENKEKKEYPPISPQGGTHPSKKVPESEKRKNIHGQDRGSGARVRVYGDMKKPVRERMQWFQEQIRPFVPRYGRDMCNAFYSYWSELSQDGSYMRFETKRTWETERRLQSWDRYAKRLEKAGKCASQSKSEEISEQMRVEHEQRRILDRLECVPPWVLKEAEKRGMKVDGITASDIYGRFEAAASANALDSEVLERFEQWKQDRNKLQKMLVNG